MIILLKFFIFAYILPMIIGLIGEYIEFEGETVSEFLDDMNPVPFVIFVNVVYAFFLILEWLRIDILIEKIGKLKIK